MAAVFVPPSPHAIGVMAGRRAPLSNLPNAGNSPYRGPAAAGVTSSKRSRSFSTGVDDELQPAKRPILELDVVSPAQQPRTPLKQSAGAALNRRTDAEALARKARIEREKQLHAKGRRQQDKAEGESHSLDSVRQWQRHYRKAFLSYVFYFESVPEESKRHFQKGILSLGAREVKFFSKEVTHVVTTRAIPNDIEATASPDGIASSAATTAQQEQSEPKTINPTLLHKGNDGPAGQKDKRLGMIAPDVDIRKPPAPRVDILLRAKDMGIKIWQGEKLNRVLHTMFGDPDIQNELATRGNVAVPQGARASKQTDLSQMIKNERMQGTAAQFNISNAEIIPFKGPYILITCMNESTKPIMTREYRKVQRREDGDWPQFRSASMGKCPFVEELPSQVQRTERLKEIEVKVHVDEPEVAPRTRAAKAAQIRRSQSPEKQRACRTGEKSLAELRQPRQQSQHLPPQAAEDVKLCREMEEQKPIGSIPNLRAGFVRAEPMASGMQTSNVTSAIRSQVISSTAAAPGAKAGTSREIHGLQRKVLERNAVPTIKDLRGMVLGPEQAHSSRSNPRIAKQKAQEKLGYNRLGHIREDEQEAAAEEPSAAEQRQQQRLEEKTKTSKAASLSKKQGKQQEPPEREPRPGYCENCQEKYEDFQDHIASRKHKKFALSDENWKDLDRLLSHLARPLKLDCE